MFSRGDLQILSSRTRIILFHCYRSEKVDPEQHPQLGLSSIVPGYIVRPGQIRTLLQRLVKYAAKARLVHLSASSIIVIVVGAPISPAESLVSHDTNT